MRAVGALTAASALVPAVSVMNLVSMSDEGLKGRGAVCLDGTDAAFYFSPAADAANANNWQLYFEGGGWCYDPMDCWGRSNGSLGSSTGYPPSIGGDGGIISDDCNENPDFCKFNRVYMKYCDGNSFSGDRPEPLVVTGLDGKKKPLYFRGKRIIDAVLATLKKSHNLSNATNVILTGCSAGGLATYLHADYVHDSLVALGVKPKKYKAAPISGFFLLHQTVDGKAVYPEEMKTVFEMSGAQHGVNQRCASAMKEKAWMCNFAQYSYKYTQVPIFPLNSAYDSWQSACIYGSELAPGYPSQNVTDNGECARSGFSQNCFHDPEGCNATEIAQVNKYVSDFGAIIRMGAYQKPGNGAFIHTCYTHCEAQGPEFSTFQVNGVSMKDAVSRWWQAEGEPAEKHSHDGSCSFASSSPHQCNPSCSTKAQSFPPAGIVLIV